VYGKNADTWAADNIASTNSQNQQYAVQLQDKEGYRTCEYWFFWKVYVRSLRDVSVLYFCESANAVLLQDKEGYCTCWRCC